MALPFITLGTLVETSLVERATWREESLKGDSTESIESILNQLKTVESVEKNITPLEWPPLYSVLEGSWWTHLFLHVYGTSEYAVNLI